MRPCSLVLALAALPAAVAAAPAPLFLETFEEARRLCADLELPERVARADRTGDPARAHREQVVRRRRARAGRYRIDVDGAKLHFDYDPEGKQLTLRERSQLIGAGGALRVWAVDDPELPVAVDDARARRTMAEARADRLVLRIELLLPEDGEVAICSHPPGSHHWSLGVAPVSWSYRVGGEVLARGGEAAEAPAPAPRRGGSPRVSVGEPVGGSDAARLRAAVSGRSAALSSCYLRALQAHPGLDGTLAVELELDPAGGAPRALRVALDSVLDEGLRRCALAALRQARFPAGPGGRVQLPLHFALGE